MNHRVLQFDILLGTLQVISETNFAPNHLTAAKTQSD